MAAKQLVFSEAVSFFWQTRTRQTIQQENLGRSDQGARGAVTGGQQMDGFLRAIADLMADVGVVASDIYTQRRQTELPGFYRPTKGWDMLVVIDNQLVAAIELKSQVGPSFGNNFNNRTEEALGTALDTWTAYRESAFRAAPAPWLGYLFLLEDCAASRRPVSVLEPHFPVFDVFQGASYAERYELFCRRLVLERQYSATCFLLSDRLRAVQSENYREPAEDLSSERFVSSLLRHVRRR